MRFKYNPLEEFSQEQRGTGFKIATLTVVDFTFSYLFENSDTKQKCLDYRNESEMEAVAFQG